MFVCGEFFELLVCGRFSVKQSAKTVQSLAISGKDFPGEVGKAIDSTQKK